MVEFGQRRVKFGAARTDTDKNAGKEAGDRRFGTERRSGDDTRTQEEISQVGDRRSLLDRRAVADRRKMVRRRVLKGVKIAFQDDFCSVDGTMKNISGSGAFVALKDGFLVPDSVTLFNELDGYKVAAEVVRRSTNAIGVHFKSAPVEISKVRTQRVCMVNDQPLAEKQPRTSHQEPVRPTAAPARKPVFGKLGRTPD